MHRVHDYPGLIRGQVAELRLELQSPGPLVVATTGYAQLITAKRSEISGIEPNLTLEGLWLVWTVDNGVR
jgi:pantothenate kinase type III